MPSIDRLAPRRTVQKICTLRTHEESFSREDVLFNFERFSELDIKPGQLASIVGLHPGTAVRDFDAAPHRHGLRTDHGPTEHPTDETARLGHVPTDRAVPAIVTIDENGNQVHDKRQLDRRRCYVFVAKEMTPELKSKSPGLVISIASSIAAAFGFRSMSQVAVTSAEQDVHSASHVEIAFRDQYLARSDMWRLATAELAEKTVYRGQKLLFMGTIKAVVKNVYVNGESEHSAYFSPTTKAIFRSESARIVLFIQMSREMWDFDSDGSGEIMFNKVTDGFLPDLFKRWAKQNARHLITIILFTRLEYDHVSSRVAHRGIGAPDRNAKWQDFYRVVTSEWASSDWIYILNQLKKELKVFLRDVCIIPNATAPKPSASNDATPAEKEPEYLIKGTPTLAAKGNVLEAINLAISQFSLDYVDRDLVRTGISVVIITPGAGVYEVDYGMLKLTTDTLVDSGIAIDIVSLARMPLHSVPLFKYRNPRLISANAAAITEAVATVDTTEEKPVEANQDIQSGVAAQNKTLKPSMSTMKLLDQGLGMGIPSLTLPPDSLLANGLQNQTVLTPGGTSGEWTFTLPQWIDVSFWSGPSEEEHGSRRGGVGKLIRRRRGSSKRKRFQIRCRMYELQMMGIMESEMSNITIPQLVNNPFSDSLLIARLTNTLEHTEHQPHLHESPEKATNGEELVVYQERDQRHLRGHIRSWMDEYDDSAFQASSLNSQTTTYASESRRDDANRLKRLESSSASLHGASLIERRASPGSFADGSKSAFLERRMRERGLSSVGQSARDALPADASDQENGKISSRRPPAKITDSGQLQRTKRQQQASPTRDSGRTPVAELRKDTSPTLQLPRDNTSAKDSSSQENVKPKVGWLSRHISFGGIGFGTTKAIASTAVSNESGTPMNASGKSSIMANISTSQNALDQVRASLTRKASYHESLASSSTSSLENDKPSQPIAIKRSSRGWPAENIETGGPDPGSGETLRPDRPEPQSKQLQSHEASPKGPVLYSAQRKQEVKSKVDLSNTGTARKSTTKALASTGGLSPWLILVNPCNPTKNELTTATRFRRWQHVYPMLPKASTIKWKSLCSPASVPLTNDYFPTARQLAEEWEESPYKVSINDDESGDEPRSREEFMRELIAFRLAHGYQVVVGATVAEYAGLQEVAMASIFDKTYVAHDGATVFLGLGNTIHQLVCLPGGEVEIKRFKRKPTTALEASVGLSSFKSYRPLIQSHLSRAYESRVVDLNPPREEYNWNSIDNFIAGYHEEFSDVLRFWRARFVFIPVEIPHSTRRPLATVTEDSEEEVRLEGIRKLTQLWQKHSHVLTSDERHFQASRDRKDENPLAIEYQTRDPSAIVSAGPEAAMLSESNPNVLPTQLFSEPYRSSNIDIQRLAQDLQGEKGLPVGDRRWHWRLHYDCFVGFDLISWLLMSFSDIKTRDEAIELGRQLMERGLFQHVQKKHQFRDGNFFYQFASEFRVARPNTRTGWFGRKADKSVPSTPMTGRATSRATTDSPEDGEKTPVGATTPHRKVILSDVLRYDVDHRKRSYRPELINLHYDRLHNPDNCYHVRIDWMNVTAKLIEDTVVSWATLVERYGLKLVEVPIAEASRVSETHPFRSPYSVSLAVEPPESQPPQYFDATSFAPQSRSDKFVYHKAILRRLGFVLDMEALSSFPAGVDIQYSWGKLEYRYTQYVHRTGILLAQITDEGKFLLLANRLAVNRAAASREALKFERAENYERRTPQGMPSHSSGNSNYGAGGPPSATGGVRPIELMSPRASPMVRASKEFGGGSNAPPSLTTSSPGAMGRGQQTQAFATGFGPDQPANSLFASAEQIKEEVEAFCNDAEALRAFYEDFVKPDIEPSPQALLPVGQSPAVGGRTPGRWPRSVGAGAGIEGSAAAMETNAIPSLSLPMPQRG